MTSIARIALAVAVSSVLTATATAGVGPGRLYYDASGTMIIRLSYPTYSTVGGHFGIRRFGLAGEYPFGFYGAYPWFGGYPFLGAWSFYQPGSYQGPVLIGQVSRIDPALLGEQIPAGPAFEQPRPVPFAHAFDELLRAGEYDEAADFWERAESGEAVMASGPAQYEGAETRRVPVAIEGVWTTDRRLLAVAYAGAGRLELAAEAMATEHLIDPLLAARPLDGQRLASNSRALRRLVLDAIAFADRAASADAWLLAAVLVQAEGRDRVAARFVARAESAGLDADAAEAMYDALGGRPAPERP